MIQIRKQYSRFKAWQRKPFNYGFRSHDLQHCNNCGHDFTGNFCPYCSQRAGTSRITWKSVFEGISLLWGMDSRSLPYSLLQLLCRPGYFIRDYISGHRQISFPPFKMLVIVALIAAAIRYLFFPEATKPEETVIEKSQFLTNALNWLTAHEEWYALLTSTMFILPTWLLFRNAPAYPRHTIPEGFFIQTFICVIEVAFGIFGQIVQTTLSVAYFFLIYKQLFGYNWWSTIWRVLITIVLMIITLVFVVAITLIIIH